MSGTIFNPNYNSTAQISTETTNTSHLRKNIRNKNFDGDCEPVATVSTDVVDGSGGGGGGGGYIQFNLPSTVATDSKGIESSFFQLMS